MAETRPPRREIMPLARPQLKVVAAVCVPLILTCLAVSVLQTYFFLSSLRAGTQGMQTALAQEVKSLAALVAVISLLIMVPICVLVGIWVSHRIVGPMRRLARDLEAVGTGRLAGVFAVREGDDLAFIGVAVTEMKRGLRERVTALREAQSKLEAAIAKLDPNAAAEVAQASAALRAQLETFQIA